MEKEELNSFLKITNDRVYEQLSYAEAKHAVLIGFIGATIFSIVGIIIDLRECDLLWLQIWLGTIDGLFLIPLIISFSSFYPNTKALKNDRKNLYFYGDIAKYSDAESYLSDINNNGELEAHIAEQNIMVSAIVMRKHKKFSIALKFCAVSVFLPYCFVWLTQFIIHKIKK